MPNLKAIEIIMETGAWSRDQYNEAYAGRTEWPPLGCPASFPTSASLRRLNLELQVQRVNMALLKTIFPNVTFLQLRTNGGYISGVDAAPFSQICKTCPGLQGLRISGEINILLWNYDLDVLGISEDEMKFLRGMDHEDLLVINLVPIKPSIATIMSSSPSHYCDTIKFTRIKKLHSSTIVLTSLICHYGG